MGGQTHRVDSGTFPESSSFEATGDLSALFDVVYTELRALAGQMLKGKPSGETLQPTILVHETFLRLMRSKGSHWISRPYFFAAAAEAMRRILIENARRKKTLRRGGNWVRVSLEAVQTATDASSDLLLLIDEALNEMASQYPKQADVVKLMFFAGLTAKEAGEVLGVTDRTIKRHWAFARAWLYEELSEKS